MAGTRLSLRTMPVEDLMTREVKTIEGRNSLEDCIGVMRGNDIGCAVVVEKGTPVGIFTERDLLRKVADGKANLQLTMTEVMSNPLKTISPTASIWDAIEIMNNSKIRHLPVVDKGRLVGIITERDLFQLFFSQRDLLLSAITQEEMRRFMFG